jgi:predicted amidohydrolase
MQTSDDSRVLASRRQFLYHTAIAAALAAGGVRSAGASTGGDAEADNHLSVRDDGTYDTVPLRKDGIQVGVIQSRVLAIDAANPGPGRKRNLEHMLSLIDKAFHFGGRLDLLQFHEFPITGWDLWTREQSLRVAIEVPGEETEILGQKAKILGCYLVFGSYVRDPDWPGHLLSVTTIIGPDGKVLDTHWKARNIKGVFPGIELYTTTIYDVLDGYIEMYGIDHVIPVTRTDVGNIATSSAQNEPELFRAFAIKGAELMLRTATGGFSEIDVRAAALYNRFYTTIANNAVSPENPNFFPATGTTGGSAIYGPDAEPLAEAGTQHETMVRTRIPMAEFRKRHRQPMVHFDLYRPVLERYRNAYAPNLFSAYQPADYYDAKSYLKDKSRWR